MAKESKAILQNFLNKTSQITPVPEVSEDFPIKMISVYDLIPNPLNFYELKVALKLHQYGQRKFMHTYNIGIDEFRGIFGKNYLYQED